MDLDQDSVLAAFAVFAIACASVFICIVLVWLVNRYARWRLNGVEARIAYPRYGHDAEMRYRYRARIVPRYPDAQRFPEGEQIWRVEIDRHHVAWALDEAWTKRCEHPHRGGQGWLKRELAEAEANRVLDLIEQPALGDVVTRS